VEDFLGNVFPAAAAVMAATAGARVVSARKVPAEEVDVAAMDAKRLQIEIVFCSILP